MVDVDNGNLPDRAMSFCDVFDQNMAQSGVPGVFVLDVDGELRFDLGRTRDFWQHRGLGSGGSVVLGVSTLEACHCLLRDKANGWTQYVLLTSPLLLGDLPRAELIRFASRQEAMDRLVQLGALPVSSNSLS